MPIWLYDVSPPLAALIVVAFIETISLLGLLTVRHFLIPRLHYHEGANDAVSGTVQAIGVFYGITVGLIADRCLEFFIQTRRIWCPKKQPPSVVCIAM